MGITLASIGRYLCGLIDSIIYIVITKMYELFQDVSGIILYSQDMFDVIGQRIGLILGIFMLFRLAVSLINYMISPDKISDNSKGGAKMITNIIISLALLVSVNLIFNEAYKIQKRVIESRFVEKIFFGKKAEMPNVNMGYILYSSFITPNIDGCETLLDPYTEIDPKCSQELTKIQNTSINTALNNLLTNYELNKVYSNYDLLNYRLNNDWFFSYLPILSTVAGVAVVLVLISFCMDLATRAVKLLFLQIIAPIPIIANMDPAKGSEIFKKWYKECFNTYLSIFIRIIAINFAVFMITLIKTEFGNIFTGKSPLLTVLLVIGCLMFAKQVPTLIEDILGIKLDGMSLKPLKKFQEKALFGKNITSLGAAGLAGGAAMGANMISRFRQGTNEKGFARVWDMTLGTLASGVAGGLSATGRGTVGAIKGQKFGQTYQGAYRGAITARNNRNDRIEAGVNSLDIMGDKIDQALGMPTTAQRQDSSVKVYDEFVSSGEAAVSISENEIQKYANKIRLDNHTAISQVDTSAANPYGAALRAAGITSTSFSTLGELREAMSDSTRYDARVRAALNSEYERIKGQAESAYRDYATRGSAGLHGSREFSFIDATDINGQTAMAHITNVNDIFSKNKNDDVFVKNGITDVNGSNVKDVTKKVKYESTSIKNSGAYRRAHKIQQQAQKEKK